MSHRQPKHIFTYLLVISVCVSIYFAIYLISIKRVDDEKMKLNFYKDISFKEGYKFLETKMKQDFPETGFKQKPCFVYFWDDTMYDFQCAAAMRALDSLASNLGEYSFDYIFATEIDEAAAKDFLTSRGAKFKNFKVLGGMDDFISGVYNEKPPKWRTIVSSKQDDSNCPDISRMKIKGSYVLMDNKGVILYINYKYFNPLKDTTLIRKLKSFPLINKLKSQD